MQCSWQRVQAKALGGTVCAVFVEQRGGQCGWCEVSRDDIRAVVGKVIAWGSWAQTRSEFVCFCKILLIVRWEAAEGLKQRSDMIRCVILVALLRTDWERMQV